MLCDTPVSYSHLCDSYWFPPSCHSAEDNIVHPPRAPSMTLSRINNGSLRQTINSVFITVFVLLKVMIYKKLWSHFLACVFCFFKSYPVNGLSDEDFNIPPITPPTLPDHMLPPHLPHDSSGLYHSVEPPSSSAPHHHPFQLQAVELSGMPGRQDGAAVLNQDGGTFSPGGGPMTSTLSVVSSSKKSTLVAHLQKW